MCRGRQLVLCPGATSTIFRCAQRHLLTALLRNRPSRSCTWQPVPLRWFYACPTLHSCNSLQSRFFECKLQLLIPSGSQAGTSASGKYSRCENQRVDQGEPLSSRRRLRRAILPPQAEGHSAGWTSKASVLPGFLGGRFLCMHKRGTEVLFTVRGRILVPAFTLTIQRC